MSSSALFSLAVGSAASSAAGNLPSARPPLRPPLRPSEDGNGLPPLASLLPPRNLSSAAFSRGGGWAGNTSSRGLLEPPAGLCIVNTLDGVSRLSTRDCAHAKAAGGSPSHHSQSAVTANLPR